MATILFTTTALAMAGHSVEVEPGPGCAADAIEAALLSGATTVYLAAGTHTLQRSLVIDSSIHPRNASAVTIIGRPGSVLSSGISVDGWTSVGANVWSAKMPVPTPPLGATLQLWRNSTRLKIAATPMMHYVAATANNLTFKPEDIAALRTIDLDRAYIVLYQSWVAALHKISSISENGVVSLSSPWDPQWAGSASGARTYFANVKEALDADDEFFFDVAAGEVKLVSDTRPVDGEVVMALNTTLILGRNAGPMSFSGVTFNYAAVESDPIDGQSSAQSATMLKTAAVDVANSSGWKFDRCSFAHVGGYAVLFGTGTTNSAVTNSHLTDLGGGGVRIGVDSVSDASVLNNAVSNNLIEDGGHVWQAGCGVISQVAQNTLIEHNEIRYFRYTGVSTGWTWGYGPTPVRNVTTRFNHIHHIGEGFLSDMGCVYTLGHQPGSTIVNNVCHDVQSYNYGGWGYYTDEGSRDEVFRSNIATRTKCSGHHQHYGTDNVLENNIYYDVNIGDVPTPGRTEIRMPTCDSAIRVSTHARNTKSCNPDTAPKLGCCCYPGCDQGKCSSFMFRRNIVFEPAGKTRGTLVWSPFDHGLDNFTFEANVYYNASDPHGSAAAFNSTETFAGWQAHGKDHGSVNADPQFSNTTSFSLRKTSPALRLGFVPIDISHVGPQGPIPGPLATESPAMVSNVAAALAAPELLAAGLMRV